MHGPAMEFAAQVLPGKAERNPNFLVVGLLSFLGFSDWRYPKKMSKFVNILLFPVRENPLVRAAEFLSDTDFPTGFFEKFSAQSALWCFTGFYTATREQEVSARLANQYQSFAIDADPIDDGAIDIG